MKHKFNSMGRVAIALVLALSLSLVMAAPVAASHDSTASVAFTEFASTEQGQDSTLDVEVTNDGATSLGSITTVKVDFSLTDFTVIDEGTLPGTWTLDGIAGGVITYTDATGIAPGDSVVFVPAVTNPGDLGLATNPVVTTSDAGSKAVLAASAATGEIAYEAIAIGSAGNDFTVEYLDAAPFGVLDVTMVGNDISVELADNGTFPTSTATEVVAAIDTAAATHVDASTIAGATIVPLMSATALAGGSAEQLDKPCPLTGTLQITELLLTVDVTAAPATSASLATYTIDFTTIGAIAADETITITFPAEYDIALVEEVDVDVTGYAFVEVVVIDGQVVTITGDGANAIAAADEAVQVTIINAHVKNPPASGDYDIAVLTTVGDHGDGVVTITPAAFGVVAGSENAVTAGTAFAVTVTALNAEVEAETDIGYTGDHFIDFAWVGGPAGTPTLLDFDLITFTAGVGTSDQYFVLPVAEAGITITADATEPTIHGESGEITINPAIFVGFLITGEPAAVIAGDDFGANDIIVTAQDADANTVTGYTGTVTWTSTDEQAVLPAAYTFDAEDEGVHTFLGSLFTLKTVGEVDQTITVTDAAAVVSQESALIEVAPAAAASILVSASPGVILANNSDSSTITATALDEFGNTDTNYGEAVTFTANLGVLANEDAVFGAITDGVATADLTSDEVGTASIKVTSGELPYGLTTVTLLALIDIDALTVTADLSTIRNDGADVRTITVTYVDNTPATVTAADGADYTVTFTHDALEDEVTLSATEVDPVAGVATVTLTTTATAGDTITVTADGTGVSNTVQITVAEGNYSISLAAGWNLISLPLIPSSYTITDVLADLIEAETVDEVRTYDQGAWYNWASTGPVGNLTLMEDGAGYWVNMNTAGILDGIGGDIPAPPAGPRSYDVYVGWNMIGFKSLDVETTVATYLGALVEGTLEAIYGYDAAAGIYFIPVVAAAPHDFLEPGYGYWLAVNADGTIYP